MSLYIQYAYPISNTNRISSYKVALELLSFMVTKTTTLSESSIKGR